MKSSRVDFCAVSSARELPPTTTTTIPTGLLNLGCKGITDFINRELKIFFVIQDRVEMYRFVFTVSREIWINKRKRV